MAKVSYYACTTQAGKEEIIYGRGKKDIIEIGVKSGLGAFKEIKELKFADLKAKHKEEELVEIRNNSKKNWKLVKLKADNKKTEEVKKTIDTKESS